MHENGSRVSLNLPTTATVSDVKSAVHEATGFATSQSEILFCGCIMKDSDTLESYNIDSQTTLHIVSNFGGTQRSEETTTGRSEKHSTACKISLLTGIWTHRLSKLPFTKQKRVANFTIPCNKNDKSPKFFAFCKSKCTKVVQSKLRVRCATCKKNTITLNRDPKQWTDVAKLKQIVGNCQSMECSGDFCDAEFYFKCVYDYCDSEDVVPLPNVVSNLNEDICLTCLDYENPVVAFPCRSDHVMCLYCFEQYARCSLREKSMVLHREMGYSLLCPEKCPNSCLVDTHILHILGPDEYQIYQSYAAEECLLHEMKGMICPNSKCGAGLYYETEHPAGEKVMVVCSSCRYEFCSACREPFHGTTTCHASQSRLAGSTKAVEDYYASIQMIEQIAKRCPKCQAPTQRNGGCMHMTCRVCRYEWCWNCCVEWSRNCQADHWFA